MENVKFICKAAGKEKDAIRISAIADIPEFLKGSIKIVGGELKLDCVEGEETATLGSVIGWEESNSTASGYNTWCIGNADTNLVEKDGKFYTKPTAMQAAPVTDEFPAFLEGANITRNDDGSWSIVTDWGVSSGLPGKAYWVKYGEKDDGSPDANILTKSEKSYGDYFVCDEAGNLKGRLCEVDPA